MQDVIINFWMNFDTYDTCANSWYAKLYCVDGTIDEKINYLKIFSESDYLTVKPIEFPSDFLFDEMLLFKFRLFFKKHEYYFFRHASYNLVDFADIDVLSDLDKLLNTKTQKVTNSVYLITYLFQSRITDEIRPYTTAQNINWINTEVSKKMMPDSLQNIKSFNPIQQIVVR